MPSRTPSKSTSPLPFMVPWQCSRVRCSTRASTRTPPRSLYSGCTSCGSRSLTSRLNEAAATSTGKRLPTGCGAGPGRITIGEIHHLLGIELNAELATVQFHRPIGRQAVAIVAQIEGSLVDEIRIVQADDVLEGCRATAAGRLEVVDVLLLAVAVLVAETVSLGTGSRLRAGRCGRRRRPSPDARREGEAGRPIQVDVQKATGRNAGRAGTWSCSLPFRVSPPLAPAMPRPGGSVRSQRTTTLVAAGVPTLRTRA